VIPHIWTKKKILQGGEPIFLKGRKKTGILLIHGWSSTPQELKTTAYYLNQLGYWVYAPLLRGHGTEPRDLIGYKWEDWLEDACQAYDGLGRYVSGIVVGGMSTGSLLALNLSLKRRVIAIIAMGTPLAIKLRWKILVRALAWVFRKRKRLLKKIYRKEDWEVVKGKVHYFEFPPQSMWEVFRSISATKRILPQIQAPILIMQSASDRIILPQSADYLYRRIGSSIKKIIFFSDSYHVFTVDKSAPQANQAIGEFLEQVIRVKKS
jgi:carboxylesterase